MNFNKFRFGILPVLTLAPLLALTCIYAAEQPIPSHERPIKPSRLVSKPAGQAAFN